MCLICFQWIVFFLIILPSYFWPGPLFAFYENDYYCGIAYEKVLGLSYTVLNIYILPIVYLSLIYTRIMYFILHQTPQIAQTVQGKRAQRDLIITRRILITVVILTLPGLPNVGFVLMTNINTAYSGSFFMYRIQWMGPSVTVFICSLALVFLTPKLREIFRELAHRQNSIAPIRTTQHNSQTMMNVTVLHH